MRLSTYDAALLSNAVFVIRQMYVEIWLYDGRRRVSAKNAVEGKLVTEMIGGALQRYVRFDIDIDLFFLYGYDQSIKPYHFSNAVELLMQQGPSWIDRQRTRVDMVYVAMHGRRIRAVAEDLLRFV